MKTDQDNRSGSFVGRPDLWGGELGRSAVLRTDPLTVIIGGTASGSVASNPSGITCAGGTVSCTGWFTEGITVLLTATPDTGFVFVGWSGDCTGTTQPCEVPIHGVKSVAAHFASPLEYYHLDVLGSVRMVTNAAGAVVKRHDYFAFGEDTAALTGDPRRFTGKELDPETAQQYFGARYYRNVWGRFTSVDPLMDLEQNIVDPQGWNRYSYVGNRPTRIVDPDGRGWLSNAVKLVRAIAKGGNIAAEFQGVIADANTVFSGESSFGQKVLAAASLATEILSPVSARDAKGVVQTVVRRGDDLADGGRKATIGSKLDYMLGLSKGDAHDVARSLGMRNQLERIGLRDSADTRDYLSRHLQDVVKQKGVKQSNGRVIRESLLMGPHGGLKLQTIWEGDKLITMFVFGG